MKAGEDETNEDIAINDNLIKKADWRLEDTRRQCQSSARPAGRGQIIEKTVKVIKLQSDSPGKIECLKLKRNCRNSKDTNHSLNKSMKACSYGYGTPTMERSINSS